MSQPVSLAPGTRTSRPSSTRARVVAIVIILLSIDLLLIAADLLRHGGLLHDVRFAVTTERGYGEWFQYFQTAIVVALLVLAGARRKTAAAFAWAGLFAYLLLDDAFALHESVGVFAASVLPLPSIGSIQPEQAGELLFYAAVGLLFVGALAVFQRGDPASRALTVALAPAFAVLVFFGAVVDMIHSLIRDRAHRYAAGVIEDGGELLAMSLLVAIAYIAAVGDQYVVGTLRRDRS